MAIPVKFEINGRKTGIEEMRRYIVPFLFVHALIFLGVGYIFSMDDPIFSTIHSGIGILVYLIFLILLFHNKIRDILIGAALSIAIGLIFGDFLLDNFYFMIPKADLTIFHKIYSMMIVFYIYVYIDVIKLQVFSKQEQKN